MDEQIYSSLLNINVFFHPQKCLCAKCTSSYQQPRHTRNIFAINIEIKLFWIIMETKQLKNYCFSELLQAILKVVLLSLSLLSFWLIRKFCISNLFECSGPRWFQFLIFTNILWIIAMTCILYFFLITLQTSPSNPFKTD